MDWLRQMVGRRRGLDRRHPGHGEHRDAGRADLRARAGVRAGAGRARAAGGRAAAGGVRVGAGAQLDREGDAARGFRQGAPAADRHRRGVRDARRTCCARRSSATPPRGCSRARSWPPRARRTRRRSIRSRRSPRWRGRTGSGCTSTRRWPGRRWCCPSAARRGRAVEEADSLVFNPHKWMGAGFDLSAYYCRDPQHLIRVMGTNPSYLRTQQDGEVSNFRDWHVQLGRRFRALKLWFYLLDVGRRGAAREVAARPRERALARRAGGGNAGVASCGTGRAADGVPPPRAARPPG